jgi:hypothetical protein
MTATSSHKLVRTAASPYTPNSQNNMKNILSRPGQSPVLFKDLQEGDMLEADNTFFMKIELVDSCNVIDLSNGDRGLFLTTDPAVQIFELHINRE